MFIILIKNKIIFKFNYLFIIYYYFIELILADFRNKYFLENLKEKQRKKKVKRKALNFFFLFFFS